MTIFYGKMSLQERKGTLTEWKQPYKETEQYVNMLRWNPSGTWVISFSVDKNLVPE